MAYVMEARAPSPKLEYLPLSTTTRAGVPVQVDYAREDELEACRSILNGVIEEGQSYPFRNQMSPEVFREYFLAYDAFVVRSVSGEGGEGGSGVLGAFYIKPNFPGRASHICNGGFVVSPAARRQGVATLMARCFLPMGRDLGYRASLFNLVFVSNEASLRLWTGLGFVRTGTVPKAGELKGLGFVDAAQFWYDLTTVTTDLSKDKVTADAPERSAADGGESGHGGTGGAGEGTGTA